LTESKPPELASLDFPYYPEGPAPHPPRFIDPRIVEAHFAPLLKNLPSAEERWARKANSTPFTGL
jgi:hypothetical protein